MAKTSSQSVPSSRKRNKVPVFVLLGALALVGVAIFLFTGYRSHGDKTPLQAHSAQVIIGAPVSGSVLVAFDPLQVEAIAVGPEAFLSIELWVNGELAAVRDAPSSGRTSFSTRFGWFPSALGAFSLIARAIDSEGQTVSSPAVVVFVASTDKSLTDFPPEVQDSPAFFEAPASGYVPPQAPSADSSVGPAEDWSGSPSDWIDNLTNDIAPAAPELFVEAQSCAAQLSIHDFSDNEEGFAVYRQLSNSPNWQLITTLASQSENDWITFSDEAVGGVTYYVAAFNSQGQMQSNLALANIDPTNCSQPSSSQPLLTVLFNGLVVEGAPESSYCYRSVNDSGWTRWPLEGFFQPGEDGSFAEGETFNFLLSDPDQPSGMNSIDLRLECWGRFGGNLQYLGNLVFEDLGPNNVGSIKALSDVVSAEIIIYLAPADNPLAFTFGDQGIDLEDLSERDLIPHSGSLGNFDLDLIPLFITKIDPETVGMDISITEDYDECVSHLPNEIKNDPNDFNCFNMPGFNEESEVPQPYLVWDFLQTCLAGNDSPVPCYKTYLYWRAMADYELGQVGFDIWDYNNANGGQAGVQNDTGIYKPVIRSGTFPDGVTSYSLPFVNCTGQRKIYMQMWYQSGAQKIYGPMSNPASIDCPFNVHIPGGYEPLPTVDITFDSLHLLGTDDDDNIVGVNEIVEVYGLFAVGAPSALPTQFPALKIGDEGPSPIYCPAAGENFLVVCRPEMFDDEWTAGGSGNLLANYYLCQSQDAISCSSDWKQNINTLTVSVADGDGLDIWVEIWDWDDASGVDLVCLAHGTIASRTQAQWSAASNVPFTFVGSADSGFCAIEGHLN